MQIQELWQELDDEQAAKISGGEDWSIAWSIGFADVVRPATSKVPGTIIIVNKVPEQAITPPTGKIRGTLIF